MGRLRTLLVLSMIGLMVSAVSGSGISTSDAADPPLERFNILTHNVYTVFGAPGIDQRVDLIAASDYIRGYDAIILEEMFNDSASERLLQALGTEYPYQTPVLGRDGTLTVPDCAANDCWNSSEGLISPDIAPEDGGVVILSRWPIRERRQVIFSTSCDTDGFASKGFAYIRIDIEGTPVHIIATHLQSDPSNLGALGKEIAALRPCPAPADYPQDPACPGESRTPYEAVRLAQVMQMSAWIAQQDIPADQMVIIGGDLNLDKVGSPAEYERMLCALNVSEPIFSGNPEMSAPWYTWDTHLNGLLSPDLESLYIDYLLVRRDHAQPAAWHNDVIYASPFPVTWNSGYARGYEYSDHFPVAGYSDPADTPPPITTRVLRCAPDELTCDAPCPPGFTAAERLCYRLAGDGG
jgi:endonuclease/exonuclease/phosphatase family metal-dependent hydrolase